MQSTQVQPDDDELRVEPRSNIFVMAALYAEGRPVTPVRLRNISRTGALIEAAALPSPGSVVRLSRATLAASGTLLWVRGSKGGIQFESPVAVGEWLPQGRRGFGQQFVDELFHQKRLGGVRVIEEGTGGLADELLGLRSSLECAAEDLALDAAVAARHLPSLQAIDKVGHALAKLASEIALQSSASATAQN
jgi:hypothetical protein